jgi:hypothetical protein
VRVIFLDVDYWVIELKIGIDGFIDPWTHPARHDAMTEKLVFKSPFLLKMDKQPNED